MASINSPNEQQGFQNDRKLGLLGILPAHKNKISSWDVFGGDVILLLEFIITGY